METYTLYRFFNEENELLYVGISMDFWNRFKNHQNRKSWWREVAFAKVAHLDDVNAATHAEKVAIAEERPIYNVSRPRVDRQSDLLSESVERIPDPAPGVEAMLNRAAHWYRAMTLLNAGVSVDEVIAESQDPEVLHSLVEELPTYLRSKGDTLENAQAIVPVIYDRLAEVASQIAIGQ